MPNITDIKNKKIYKPIVLIIIDGWGLSPAWGGNAISMNNPKNINVLWRSYPHKILQSLSEVAGPYVKVGNSEIGHVSIGAGKMIAHDLVRIYRVIKDNLFFNNKVLLATTANARAHKSNLHLIGLLSDGSVHSHIDHLFALLDLCRKQNFKDVFVHAILDGQDTRPIEALRFLKQLEDKFKDIGFGQLASICGRSYAMDRDNHWDKIAKSYKAIAQGVGAPTEDYVQTIKNYYQKGISDCFIPPVVVCKDGQPIAPILDYDSVIFFNTRADRARQLSRAFVDSEIFKKALFFRQFPLLSLYFTTLTSYGLRLKVNVAFPPLKIENTLAEILSDHGLKQLHMTESEKYAHITYFFNGGHEDPFRGEDRIIIHSPHVVFFDQAPEMSIRKLVPVLCKQIQSKKYDFIVVNIPNVDILGHTGNILAISKAVLIVDKAVGDIVKTNLKVGGATIVTADHGNAEQVIHLEGGDQETLHTLNPVPFILITPDNQHSKLKPLLQTPAALPEIMSAKNTLADIAPTILDMLYLPIPQAMTGKSLLDELK